ncbi:leucine-rich repeat domain-containing protein [Chamaesiphon polymorphus]|uniref:leucine-rich repeat domain-containing protein n=1 Tax=Chamaesiphon polymorphus TaxID=2107691 RepID=UPI0011B1E1E1|nr:leucine-rich repeat domain-containing protein [Chamaesiphon polymorphus]
MTFLSLSENQIVEIEPLAGLDKLTFLGLRKNRIGNIKPLARLSNLVNLDLEGNSFAKQPCPLVPENICSF